MRIPENCYFYSLYDNINMNNPHIRKLLKIYFSIRSKFTLVARASFDKSIANKIVKIQYLMYKAHNQNNQDDYNNAIDQVGEAEDDLIILLDAIIETRKEMLI